MWGRMLDSILPAPDQECNTEPLYCRNTRVTDLGLILSNISVSVNFPSHSALGTTTAATSSPNRLSGIPTTAQSSTLRSANNAFSTTMECYSQERQSIEEGAKGSRLDEQYFHPLLHDIEMTNKQRDVE